MLPVPKVFISYSHDNEKHKADVKSLADWLRTQGIEAWIDQYVSSPSEGWPTWMQNQIATSEFVIVVVTERYASKTRELSRSGVRFESVLRTQDLDNTGIVNERFIPVLFDKQNVKNIPLQFKPYSYYLLEDEANEDFGRLLDRLHGVRPTAPPVTPRRATASFPPEPVPKPEPQNQFALAEETAVIPRVFVSYARDEEGGFNELVTGLVEQLRDDGVEAMYDKYLRAAVDGWSRWMLKEIKKNDFVLVVCTEKYLRRAEESKPSGVRTEATLILQAITKEAHVNNRFIPVVLRSNDLEHIPDWLVDYSHYRLYDQADYRDLLDLLKGIPIIIPPVISRTGQARPKPQRSRRPWE